MLDVRKHTRLGLPIAAAILAAGAVGGPALAASSGPSAHAAKTLRGPRGHTGKTGKTGKQGPAGPQGPAGSNGAPGANGTSGTAGGGGAEGTILYAAAANNGTPISNLTPGTAPVTVIYAGHGLAVSATCTGTTSHGTLTLSGATTAANAISLDGALQPVPAPVSPATTVAFPIPDTVGGLHEVLFASTDGAVVDLRFQTSTQQPGADCFAFGTRVGG